MYNNFTGHFFLLLLSLLLESSFAAEVVPPENVVNNFYHSYLSNYEKSGGGLTNRFVMPNVMQNINNSYRCNYDSEASSNNENLEKICSKKRECKSSKGNYICNWDGVWVETDTDYFTKSQDVYPSWEKNITITPLKVHDENAEFMVSLGKSPCPVTNLKVSLIYLDHNWKINGVTKY